jgi:CubicO group peptidase (beta-lactamase class C family)
MNEHPRLHTPPAIEPKEAGFHAAGLNRLSAVMQREVEARHVPGVALSIARGGKVAYRREFGALRPGGQPMPADAIFRIYSMTKPIVSAALMMLVEEGRLFVGDPLAKFIPEFGNMKVGIEKDGKLDFVPAEKAITIQDLLRHTSGLTYAFTGNSPVQRLYGQSNLFAPDPTNAKAFLARDLSTAEFAVELAKLPLIDQPGASWYYSHSTDVIGRVVEIVSGERLGAFLQARILAPLGMVDTAFYLPAEKSGRLAEPFERDPDSGKPVQLVEISAPPRFESGGGGLYSTMNDYLQFALMLHGGGALGGTRFVSRKTLDYMTADQLGPKVRIANTNLLQPGHRFGLGFSVRLETGQALTAGTPGEYSWGGLAGTVFWVAPKEELVAIMLIQGPGQRDYFRQLFRNLVHAAMI